MRFPRFPCFWKTCLKFTIITTETELSELNYISTKINPSDFSRGQTGAHPCTLDACDVGPTTGPLDDETRENSPVIYSRGKSSARTVKHYKIQIPITTEIPLLHNQMIAKKIQPTEPLAYSNLFRSQKRHWCGK